MTRVRLDLAYDGTDFHGFAKQRGLRTVQGTLEDSLGRILGCPVEVNGSGRTDAGVHARAQVVHWDQDHGPPATQYAYLLKRALPGDIVALKGSEVADDFHARFSALSKTYRYAIQLAKIEDVFTKRYAWNMPRSLDIEAMIEAAKHLVGQHDFTTFCAANTPIENKRREILSLQLIREGTYLHVDCRGDGFLRNMVRIIAGTLVDVGLGKFSPDSVPMMLGAMDRRAAGQTAPPYGLTLWHVEYAETALDHH